MAGEARTPTEAAPTDAGGRCTRSSRAAGASSVAEMLLCMPGADVVECIHIKPGRGGVVARNAVLSSRADAGSLRSKLGRKARTAVLLPKAAYLIKVLTVPEMRGEDGAAMLALEIEADLPAEFGPFEFSYRPVGEAEGGLRTYEAYIARRQVIDDRLETLAEYGLDAEMIIPSAAIWHAALIGAGDTDLLVARAGVGTEAELARVQGNGCVSVRSISPPADIGPDVVSREVSECIRAALSDRPREGRPLVAGWVGPTRPAALTGVPVRFEDMTALFGLTGETGEQTPVTPLLAIAAWSLAGVTDAVTPETANLMPRSVRLNRLRRGVYRHAVIGAVAIVLGLAALFGAIEVLQRRYEARSRELGGQIAAIKSRGEAIGSRIVQLNAVRDTQVTQNDLYDTITGLCDATPPGVSFNQVELSEDGDISLRGQAESVSQPVLLPELLVAQRMFDKALLKSVGQRSANAGSSTQFVLKCRLRREGAR